MNQQDEKVRAAYLAGAAAMKRHIMEALAFSYDAGASALAASVPLPIYQESECAPRSE